MNLNTYLIKAIQASIEAGRAILDVYHSDFEVEYKTDSSPLTLADKKSHDVIVSYLNEFNVPILSEEGKGTPFEERKTWSRLWIVDPLDGTKEFIKRNGEFTVNIALVESGKPMLGVIFVPDKQTLYFGADGLGAFKLEKKSPREWFDAEFNTKAKGDQLGEIDGQLTKIIDRAEKMPVIRSPLSSYTIVGSRSHQTPELQAYVEEKRREFGDVDFIAAGSSQKFCVVAEGRADIYPRLGPTMEWDTAAGQAIAENAGCTVVHHETLKPLKYNKDDLYNPFFLVRRES
jgi:3'(2'), 5'-bisphosphate nucleotidase